MLRSTVNLCKETAITSNTLKLFLMYILVGNAGVTYPP